MTKEERAVLKKWLDTEFAYAAVHDTKRLEESIQMLVVGRNQGDSALLVMGIAISSFVTGLIEGDVPITVDRNMN